MAANSTRSTLSRQWELLKLLPSRGPGLTASQITEKLKNDHGVNKRTVERDLQELSRLFPLQCNDRGKPYGWHWRPGAQLELPGIELSEALSLALLEDTLKAVLPLSLRRGLEPRFQQARRKLEALAAESATARWVDKVASVQPQMSLQTPDVNEALLERIQLGLLEERQVRCRYYAAHQDKERELILNPLALVQRGSITYLIATAEPYSDIRQYALHRFRAVDVLDTPLVRVAGFSLQAYLASDALQFGAQEPVRLQAWVSDTLARMIRETPLSPDMTLEPGEEGFCLQATVRDSWQLRWWLLQQGENICVQAPASLREALRETLRRALARYE